MAENLNYFIECNSPRCLGCKSCVLACALAHDDRVPRNKVTNSNGIYASIQCQQCEDAACIKACPKGIITQENGRVKINEELCIGCKACAKACPYDAITMTVIPKSNETSNRKGRKALKCDLCGACVPACPTKALRVTTQKRRNEYDNQKVV